MVGMTGVLDELEFLSLSPDTSAADAPVSR
jgi:hypothetical protein